MSAARSVPRYHAVDLQARGVQHRLPVVAPWPTEGQVPRVPGGSTDRNPKLPNCYSKSVYIYASFIVCRHIRIVSRILLQRGQGGLGLVRAANCCRATDFGFSEEALATRAGIYRTYVGAVE